MKNKIFNKMKEYGWNLEDFNEVYNIHERRLNNEFDYMRELDDFTDMGQELRFETLCFITDFLRAINDLESENNEIQNIR